MLGFIKGLAPLFLYIAGIVVLFIVLSGKVRYGLYFLVPLIPLQNVIDKLHPFPLGNNFNDVLLAGMFIGWLVSRGSSKEPLMGKSSLNFVLFLLLLYTYFSLWKGSFFLGHPPPIDASQPRLQNWKNYMMLPLLFFLTANNLRNEADFKKLFWAMCASMFLMNFYNVRQIDDMGSWISRAKVHGTFVWLGANEVAAFYATYTFVLLGIFFFEKNKRNKMILGFLILLNLYIDLFMFSRGAYAATLMAFLFIAVMRKRWLIVPIVLVLVFWQTVLPQKVIDRLTFSEEEGQLDYSAAARLDIWEESLMYFQQDPITGVGFNVMSSVGMRRDTHNVFLKTLAEQGVIGFIFLLILMGTSFSRGMALFKRAESPFFKGLGFGFAACVLAVIVGNAFGDRWTHLPLGAFFWVYLGMVERANNMLAAPPKAVKASTKKSPRRI